MRGYLDWSVPSIDVIYTLELLNLPYTGPNTRLYDPSKELMKYVAFCANVHTPSFQLLDSNSFINEGQLQFPLFIKPAKAGDSLGIDEKSLVHNSEQLQEQVSKLLISYDELLVEEYIDGREFTVLVAADADGKTCKAFAPVEYVFLREAVIKPMHLKHQNYILMQIFLLQI